LVSCQREFFDPTERLIIFARRVVLEIAADGNLTVLSHAGQYEDISALMMGNKESC
jgi:hypothetical protein